MFHFNILPLKQQCKLLAENGTFISSRKVDNHCFSLFALHEYFAEAYTDWAREKIIEIEVFKNITRLDPYLADISFPEING